MISIARRLSRRLRREDGFTLIELLVTMSAGLVVLAGVVTVMSVALRQTSYTFTRVDATERARTMLARLGDEMHSACLSNGVTPIQGGAQGSQVSDANNLVFVSQYGTSVSPTPVEHKITYNATRGTLTEYTYNVTGGSDPTKWAFATTPTNSRGQLLLDNVSQILTTGAHPTYLPIFQYFAYEPYTDGNGDQAMMLLDGTQAVPGSTSFPNPDPLPTTTGLSPANAALAAEVLVNVLVGAHGGNFENTNLTSASDPVTDSIVLRFTPPPNAAISQTSFGPCA